MLDNSLHFATRVIALIARVTTSAATTAQSCKSEIYILKAIYRQNANRRVARRHSMLKYPRVARAIAPAKPALRKKARTSITRTGGSFRAVEMRLEVQFQRAIGAKIPGKKTGFERADLRERKSRGH